MPLTPYTGVARSPGARALLNYIAEIYSRVYGGLLSLLLTKLLGIQQALSDRYPTFDATGLIVIASLAGSLLLRPVLCPVAAEVVEFCWGFLLDREINVAIAWGDNEPQHDHQG